MAKKNKKSDVKAKKAYKAHLDNNGYKNVQIVGYPSDITAEKDGHTYYFEIKMTKQTEKYFGAATLTEWIQAFKTPDLFYFVIAKTNDEEVDFTFEEISPIEFMKHSTIPPFKIFFNINLKKETKETKRRTAIPLTNETMALLTELHNKMRETENE